MTSTAFAPTRIDTLIGASTRIDGNIACTGVLRVQGEVKGNVQCSDGSSGGLIVDGAGSVAGATSAPHIVVRGRVVGPAHSSRSVEVHAGASLIGDVSFRHLAIHAGGVIEGALSPTPAGAEPAGEADAAPAPGAEPRFAGKRMAGVAAAVAIVAVATAWIGGWLPSHGAVQEAEPTAAAPAGESEPATAARTPLRQQAPAVVERPGADAAIAAPADRQPPREEFVAVNGANPSRPAGVFLLVAHESAVLYRKKRDDEGTGTRHSAEAGEKVSVSIDAGEVVRVAKGRALEIYFQGQKVPRDLIERGAWISFVPKPASGKPGA